MWAVHFLKVFMSLGPPIFTSNPPNNHDVTRVALSLVGSATTRAKGSAPRIVALDTPSVHASIVDSQPLPPSVHNSSANVPRPTCMSLCSLGVSIVVLVYFVTGLPDTCESIRGCIRERNGVTACGLSWLTTSWQVILWCIKNNAFFQVAIRSQTTWGCCFISQSTPWFIVGACYTRGGCPSIIYASNIWQKSTNSVHAQNMHKIWSYFGLVRSDQGVPSIGWQ